MFVEYSICKLISNAIICSKKHPRMQNQNPVLRFQKFHQKMKTLCRNSEVHHQQTQAKCIFSRINIILHKAFIKPAQAQDSQESWWTKCRIHAQARGSQESRDFLERTGPRLSGKTLTKFQKISGFLGILGLCKFCALQSFQCQNFHFKISTDLSVDTSKKI